MWVNFFVVLFLGFGITVLVRREQTAHQTDSKTASGDDERPQRD
jgi:hypothetical protein